MGLEQSLKDRPGVSGGRGSCRAGNSTRNMARQEPRGDVHPIPILVVGEISHACVPEPSTFVLAAMGLLGLAYSIVLPSGM